MTAASDDGSLAALAEDDPAEMIRMLARLADDAHFDVDELVGVAKECAADGVNLFRVLADHPELTTEHLGVDLDQVDSLAATFDEAIDATE